MPPVWAKNLERSENAQDQQSGSGAAAAEPVLEEVAAEADEIKERVTEWFSQYDDVRRNAQMSPDERAHADKLKDGKWKLVIPGFARIQARRLLKKMIDRYEAADLELSSLPPPSETEDLQEGYASFFREAKVVFADNLRLLSNPFAKDTDGKPLRKVLRKRKKELETHEKRVKELDAQLRKKYGIAPYRYYR